jgi:dTDP-4-amino-4,6-dideoxygalactose transaminase
VKEQIPVTRSVMPTFEEYCAEIESLWDTRWLTNAGAKNQRLEMELACYLDSDHCTLFCNGHQALLTALELFEFPQGGEVITTPFTFLSTTQSILQAGLKPVFCDIDPLTLTLDPKLIEAAITERTVAILPVHVYGRICDVESIGTIARTHELAVIYDAAHAFGVTYKGKGVGSWGDLSMFSLHATKVFHTVEGGALTYAADAYEPPLLSRRNFGLEGAEEARLISGNTKMNEFQAAMGLCNLRHIDETLTARQRVSERYDKLLADIEGLTVLRHQQDVISNHAYYPVFFDAGQQMRDAVNESMAKEGIITRKYFYPLTAEFACVREKVTAERTPVAEKAAATVLCLPMYPDLTPSEIERVVTVLRQAMARSRT